MSEGIDGLAVLHPRGTLAQTRAALARGRLAVGFLGGSITDQQAKHNWPEAVQAWLADTYPGLRLQVENIAVGATGSDIGVFRADAEIAARGCDLVFVEYAVNDNGTPAAQRRRSREGLLRKLLATEPRDVVVVYTFSRDMAGDMLAGRMPASIADFETLTEHYNLGSVWMGLHALNEVRRGLMRWEEWLPDGLHPQARGSYSYAASVIDFLTAALANDEEGAPIPSGETLPAPLDGEHWGGAATLPMESIEADGPWRLRRIDARVGTQQWYCPGPGGRLRIPFAGRGLFLVLDFGATHGDLRVRFDGGDWRDMALDCPDWVGAEGYMRPLVFDDLAADAHVCELEGVIPERTRADGAAVRVNLVGVTRP